MATSTTQQQIASAELAVAYYRVSTAEQAREGHQSLDVQREKAHREAADRGLTIVREFTDVASGTKTNREQYQAMLTYLRSGNAGAVLVGALDRLGRNQRELLTAAWGFQDMGVELVTIDKAFDARDIVDAAIAPMMAQMESEKISMRVRGAISRAVRAGSKVGPAPYGYRKHIREGGAPEWEQDPTQAAVVLRMYELRVFAAAGYRRIADTLNDEGVPSRSGGTWTATTVQKILNNPALRGAMDYASGRYHQAIKDGVDAHLVEDFYPGILSAEEWKRLSDFNAAATTARGKVNAGGFLLSTILHCAHCGGPMVGNTNKGYRYYVCARHRQSRARCAFSNNHVAHRVETAVLEWIERHTDPALVRESVASGGVAATNTRDKRRRAIELGLAKIDAAFRGNLDLLRQGTINEEQFTRDNTPREAQRKAMIDELASIDAEAANADQAEAFIAEAPLLAKDVAVQMGHGNVGAAKAVLRRLIGSATVDTGNTITLTIAAA